MNAADKAYAELVAAAGECQSAPALTAALEAAKALSPERVSLMLAAVGMANFAYVSRALSVACGAPMPDTATMLGDAAVAAILAFADEAKSGGDRCVVAADGQTLRVFEFGPWDRVGPGWGASWTRGENVFVVPMFEGVVEAWDHEPTNAEVLAEYEDWRKEVAS